MTDEITTKDKLNLETSTIQWKALEMFFAQGKLLIVPNNADLVNTASIIADNNINELERLINDQLVEFATPVWVKSHCKDDTQLWAVVVSPYVIAQLNK